MDNDEGSTYRILKVYKRAGNAIVDRVLYSTDKNKDLGGKVDTVYLDNIIQYPILQGKSNSAFSATIPAGTASLSTTPMTTDFMNSTDLSSNQPIPDSALGPIEAPPETHTRDGEECVAPTHSKGVYSAHEDVVLSAKRLRCEATAAGEVKNTFFGFSHRNAKQKVNANTILVSELFAERSVSNTIIEWSFDQIPEALWVVADDKSTSNIDMHTIDLASTFSTG